MIRSLAIVAALCLCGTSAKAELTMQECRAKYKAEQAAGSVRIGLTSKKRNVGIRHIGQNPKK
jgi:P pilus assembly chaperone PapD